MLSFPCRLTAVFSSALALGLLAGCGMGVANSGSASAPAALGGRAMGGQQPIVGATVSLFAPGITGYGSAPTLLSTTVTGVGGNFTLPPYVCPATDTVTYLMVTGGDTGAGVNALAAEAALLPRCSQLSASTFIIVSEVTTVAAAYTLAPFVNVTALGTNVGTSATNVLGLNNTFGVANNLTDFSTGRPRQAAELSGITPPAAQITTLANIIAACVNTTGSLAAGSTCNTLFANTTIGGVAPLNTLQAAFNIALRPGTNVAALFALASSSPPFGGGLTFAPNDYTLGLAYTANGISAATTGIAIDATGNAWISTGEFNNTVHQLTEISPAGVYLSGTTGFGANVINGPETVAISSTGNIYVACAGGNNLVKFNPNGSYNSSIAAASFRNPNGASVGPGDDIFVSNFNGTSLTRILNSTQTEAPNSPFSTGTEGVEIAHSTTATWVANYQSNSITRVANGTFALQNASTSTTPSGLAIDGSNNVWVTLLHGVAKYSDAGTLLSPTAGYQGNSFIIPQSVIVDGLGRVFASVLVNSTQRGGVLEFDGAGTLLSPALGFFGANSLPVKPAVPGGIAIDGSGNLWVTGDANGSSVSTLQPTVSEIIGIAAPVITPRAVATTGGIAVRP